MSRLDATRALESVPLGDIADVLRGVSYPGDEAQSESFDGAVPILRATNIARAFSSAAFVWVPPVHVRDDQYIRPGDIAVAASSGSKDLVGKAVLVPTAFRGSFGAFCYVVRPRSGLVKAPYLAWFLQSDAYRRRMTSASAGTNINNLRRTDLESVPVPFGSPRFQQRTIETLDDLFSHLDAAEQLIERARVRLDRLRASVLQAAVTGRLVPTEAELAGREGRTFEPASVLLSPMLAERRRRWEASGRRGKYEAPAALDPSSLPPLPEGWCWTSVQAAGDVLLGRQRAPQYLTGRFPRPYLRVANVKDDRLDVSDVKEMDFDADHFARYRLLPGDILISEGQSPERVGESAIYRGGVDGLCFQKTLHRFRAAPGLTSPEYAQIVFRAHVRAGLFLRLASITTNIAHLTLEKFCATPFPLPPRAEQDRIVEHVHSLLSEESASGALVTSAGRRIGSLRRSTLRLAFTGRLVGPDPSEEPTSVLLGRVRASRSQPLPKRGREARARKKPA